MGLVERAQPLEVSQRKVRRTPAVTGGGRSAASVAVRVDGFVRQHYHKHSFGKSDLKRTYVHRICTGGLSYCFGK